MPGDVNEVGGFNGKSPFKVEGDWLASTKKYAEWVSETLHQLVELRGFTNVTYIHLFTEPQYAMKFNYQIDNKHAYELWYDCAKAVNEQLVKDNRRDLVKIIGPNEGSTATSIMNKWVAENADEYVDIYSSHNYQDFVVDDAVERDVAKSLIFSMPGSRVQQEVDIKPNTDYIMETELAASINDRLTVSGGVVIGAWSVDRLGKFDSIQSGGQSTGRLGEKSTTLIDAIDIPEEKKKFTFTFNR